MVEPESTSRTYYIMKSNNVITHECIGRYNVTSGKFSVCDDAIEGFYGFITYWWFEVFHGISW